MDENFDCIVDNGKVIDTSGNNGWFCPKCGHNHFFDISKEYLRKDAKKIEQGVVFIGTLC